MTVSSMREVRGVRSSTAARISLANAKSDCATGTNASPGEVYRLHCALPAGSVVRRCAASGALAGAGLFALPEAERSPFARAIGNEPALVKQQQTVDQGEQRQPMGRDDDRHLAVRERLQPLEELGFAAHVKMRGRLVEEQYFGRLMRTRARPIACFCPPDRLRPPSAIGIS